jgi:hypothetical protein
MEGDEIAVMKGADGGGAEIEGAVVAAAAPRNHSLAFLATGLLRLLLHRVRSLHGGRTLLEIEVSLALGGASEDFRNENEQHLLDLRHGRRGARTVQDVQGIPHQGGVDLKEQT